MTKYIKKMFWLEQKHIDKIKKEATKRKTTGSALIRQIIINWFEK